MCAVVEAPDVGVARSVVCWIVDVDVRLSKRGRKKKRSVSYNALLHGNMTKQRTGVFVTISIRFAPFVQVDGSSAHRTASEGGSEMGVASAGESVTLQRKGV